MEPSSGGRQNRYKVAWEISFSTIWSSLEGLRGTQVITVTNDFTANIEKHARAAIVGILPRHEEATAMHFHRPLYGLCICTAVLPPSPSSPLPPPLPPSPCCDCCALTGRRSV